MAERLTLAYATQEREALGGVLTASSAGTAALVGHPMERSAQLVLAGLGGTADGFRARQLDESDIQAADLVFTMTRRQRAAVLQLGPRMMARTFTLREAASLLQGVDVSRFAGELDLAIRGQHLASTLAQLRGGRIVQRDRQRDDISDPIGGDLDKFQRVGDAIAQALLPLLGALAGTAARRAPPSNAGAATGG